MESPDHNADPRPSGTGADALRAAHARLAGILDIAEDAIISVNLEQHILLFNGGAERIFGYAAPEILGRHFNVLLPERFAADHPRHVAAFARSGVGSRRMADRREVLGRRKDGSEFPAEVSISCFVHDGETVLTAILRDVTARKQAEAEIHRLNGELEQRVRDRTAALEEALASLRTRTEEIQAMTQQLWHAAKLASVGELAASIAHELNNPLATVTLRVEAVLAQTPEGDPRRRALLIIEQETRRMADLVANLLQFSRRSGDAISTVDIRDELAKALDLVHHHLRKRAIAVGRDLADGTPPIHADRQKLRQVFLNLLANACDAMPEGAPSPSAPGRRRSTTAGRPSRSSSSIPGSASRRSTSTRSWSRSSRRRPRGRGPASAWRSAAGSSTSTGARSRSPARSARARPSASCCPPRRT